MKKQKIQDRIQILREGLGLDRHQFAERIGLSYTAVWNWETKGTEDTFIPEDPSLRKIVAAFPIVTFEWLKYGTGPGPQFEELPADTSKMPEVLRLLEGGIRALEREPLVASYLAMVEARKAALAT
jgi:transcriptional regulator with XRE-family HTH domain